MNKVLVVYFIFIGTPNWFKTQDPSVMSFLRQYDFTIDVLLGNYAVSAKTKIMLWDELFHKKCKSKECLYSQKLAHLRAGFLVE